MKAQNLRRLAVALAVIATASCAQAPQPVEREATQARMTDGKTLFEEKCATVAGERIYRKVENVEGLLLMKLRPQAGEAQWKSRDWPGAAFARESFGDEFITTFLGYEYGGEVLGGAFEPVRPDYRGFISTNRRPGGLPGYRWVEVIDEKDGKRYRYTGRWEEPWQKDKNWLKGYIKFYLDKSPSPSPTPPRYGVTYEDHVIPEERYLGLASSTVKVIDLQTNETLGEMLRYAWSPGAPSRVNPSPWLTAYRCPDHARGTNAATRKFVDQILIPPKEQ